MELSELIEDIADALAAVDASEAVHKQFQPGIGPFGEAEAVRAMLAWLKNAKLASYGNAVTKRLPDLFIPGQWAVELKIVRPFGDNGREAEHWSVNCLHPYRGNTSSLGDCMKLLASTFTERKAVVIFGFEHTPPQLCVEPTIQGFELLARELLSLRLSSRHEALRTGLVHPVHQQLRVYGFEVLGQTVTGV